MKRPVVLIKTDNEEKLFRNYRRKNVQKAIRLAKERDVAVIRHGIKELPNLFQFIMRQ